MLYIGVNDSQEPVQRSVDGGQSFAPYYDGVASYATPSQILATASGGGTQLLLATSASGFARSAAPADRLFADGFDPR